MLIQWGGSKNTEISGSDRVIKVKGLLFTQPPMVVFSPYFSAMHSNNWYPDITDISATSFTINTRRTDNGDLYAAWIAIGY